MRKMLNVLDKEEYEDSQREVCCVYLEDGSIGVDFVNKLELPPYKARLQISATAAKVLSQQIKELLRRGGVEKYWRSA